MRGRILLLLIVAIVVAAGTGYLVLQRLQRPAPAPGQTAGVVQEATVKIAVATRDLPSGHRVQADDLRFADWPANALPPGSLRSGEAVVGEVVRLPVAMNTPVLTTQLVARDGGSTLAYLLAEQRVAKTIALTETGGLAGHVMPGDHVDVLLTHEVAPPADANGSQPLQMTETLLIHIKVLATDQRTDDVNGQVIVSKTATLEVSSKEAEMLALAQQVGQLSLALNSAVEPASFDPRRAFEVRRAHIASYTGTAELTFVSAPPPVPTAKQPAEEAPAKGNTTHVVIVVRGSQQQEMTFDGDKSTSGDIVPQQSIVPDAGQGRSASMAVKLEAAP